MKFPSYLTLVAAVKVEALFRANPNRKDGGTRMRLCIIIAA